MKRERSPAEMVPVDDDRVIRLAFDEGLRNTHFSTNTASDGKEAIAICEKLHYELAVIDQELPDSPGLEFAIRLQHEFGIPFILLTASATCRWTHQAAGQADSGECRDSGDPCPGPGKSAAPAVPSKYPAASGSLSAA